MKVTIDNITVDAEAGETILTCARRAGIEIPTLCHKDGIEPYSSCMVCQVRNKRTNNYIPACSALAEDGMEIDGSGEDVINLRRKALTLLLMEHRAECEAPCRLVCPAGYNIPLLNRLLANGKFDEVTSLVASETEGTELHCLTCKGFCENACRRKKIDIPVSIRNIKIFIWNNLNGDISLKPEYKRITADELRKKFSSRIGKLEESEQKEWLKECRVDIARFREITDFASASAEAESCMHCDCRAAENCRLRELAEQFGLKDPKGKLVGLPISKKVNKKAGLIFENAKCIKCALCVRISEDSVDKPSLCFLDRGFISVISEPLTNEFDDILKETAEKCIEVCPTGALANLEQ